MLFRVWGLGCAGPLAGLETGDAGLWYGPSPGLRVQKAVTRETGASYRQCVIGWLGVTGTKTKLTVKDKERGRRKRTTDRTAQEPAGPVASERALAAVEIRGSRTS